MTAVICVQTSIYTSRSSFTACWTMGIALLPILLSWCANVFVSSSNILLQSGSRLSHSRKQLTYSSSSVSSSAQHLLPLGVAGQSRFGVPIFFGLLGFHEVIPASFSLGAAQIVPASFSVGFGGIVPASSSVGVGGIIPASFSAGVLVPSSDSPSARSIKSPPMLLLSVSSSSPVVKIGMLGNGSILLYWVMEVVRAWSGQQAVLMVRWYKVDCHDGGHPCQANSPVASLILGTISGP